METEKLIKMANQIGDFYEAYPDQAEAMREIAGHLNKFWNSAMRKSIAAHVKEKQGTGLHACVIKAIQQHLKLS
jgi:formate dehydrogenase subunit delta